MEPGEVAEPAALGKTCAFILSMGMSRIVGPVGVAVEAMEAQVGVAGTVAVAGVEECYGWPLTV